MTITRRKLLTFLPALGMAGLIGLIRQGFFSPDDNVLFLHTGGSTSLFAYEDQILGSMG